MLIVEELNRLHPEVEAAVAQLFQKAYENQQHEQDLLLAIENAAYDKSLEGNSLRLSPYVIGPQGIGWAYKAIYDYLKSYEDSYIVDNDIIKSNTKSGDTKQIREWEEQESIAIQLGLYAYLKFWESDYIIRHFYQLTNLACGEPYDWHLNFDEEKSRQKTVRVKIRNRLQSISPLFYDLLRNSYKPQLRNAIAHSLYYFIGSTIHFMNYGTNPGDDLNVLKFDELRTYLHYTFLLFNEIIGQRLKWHKTYGDKALKESEKLEILITKKKIEEQATTNLKYYPTQDRWGYQQ
ncbi:hypothetical protein WJR50_21585 [Catalinimonas sp. 4WD22]|uniref:hypothetical protein n=1 Tax=Catalinimonas locisalis TaxID=3133978 RepID=UPI0031017918